MTKSISYLLFMTLVFVFVQSLTRPASEIKVSNQELGMVLEDQTFFNHEDVDVFLKKKYEKRELMLEKKLTLRKERLEAFKKASLIFFLFSLISVFIFNGRNHLYISLGFLSFTLTEFLRFGLTELFFGLIVISIIHLTFYLKRHDGKLPEGWDKGLSDKFKK